jgi:hypothetical protein
MQFCKDCGGVLNLFGNDQGDLCSACIQHQRRLNPPAPVVRKEEKPDLLADAVLLLENGRMVLRSKEGWELWSAPAGVKTDLKTLLARARRIYEIRLRRQKN